jgi:hypothetical protein
MAWRCLSRSCSLFNYSRSKAPHPSPLPEGEGADRGVLRHASTWETEAIMDGKNALVSALGFGFRGGRSGRRRSPASPNRSPLPLEGDGADRGVLRHASTWETEAIMDGKKSLVSTLGFGFRGGRSGRRRSPASPNRSPLFLEVDGADRGVLRHTSTWETEAIMDGKTSLVSTLGFGFRGGRSGRRRSLASPNCSGQTILDTVIGFRSFLMLPRLPLLPESDIRCDCAV